MSAIGGNADIAWTHPLLTQSGHRPVSCHPFQSTTAGCYDAMS
jgi:hypothetical protein